MKFTWKDIILTTAVVCLILLGAFSVTDLCRPLFKFLPKEYSVIPMLAIFVGSFVFLLGGVYTKILRLFLPDHDLKFVPNDNSTASLVWRQTVFAYEWTASILSYITPVILRSFLFRLLGAKMGDGVLIGGKIVEPQLVEIGDFSFLGEMSLIMAHAMTREAVILKRIVIGKNATVGAHAIIMPGVRIGDGAVVACGSVVPTDTIILPNEVWGGVPAKRIKAPLSEKEDIDSGEVSGLGRKNEKFLRS